MSRFLYRAKKGPGETVEGEVVADSEAEQCRRLEDRGSEVEVVRQQRLAELRGELDCLPEFDYVVINRAGALDDAVATLHSIIIAEKARLCRRQPGIG